MCCAMEGRGRAAEESYSDEYLQVSPLAKGILGRYLTTVFKPDTQLKHHVTLVNNSPSGHLFTASLQPVPHVSPQPARHSTSHR